MNLTPHAFVLALVTVAVAASEPAEVATAAKNFYPAATWQPKSTLVGDFSCRGKPEVAILGTASNAIIVAVFLDGLDHKPQVLEYSAQARNASTAVLTTESLGSSLEEIESDIGYIPEGMRPSKTCLGLNMSDQTIDAAHIYWNHKARTFNDWVR